MCPRKHWRHIACFITADARFVNRTLLGQDVTFHDKKSVGGLTSRLTADCASMSLTIGLNINLIIRNFFKSVGGALYLWWLSPEFFAITGIALVFILTINIKYGRFYRKSSAVEQEQLAITNEIAQEALGFFRYEHGRRQC